MADQGVLPERSQAADLEPKRRRFTADDVFKMLEAGILAPEERVELIDGEVLVLSPQSVAHFQVKNRLAAWFMDRRGAEYVIFIEPTYRLPQGDLVDPDISVLPMEESHGDLAPEKTLLMVEVALSSETYDRKVKAPRYARAGVREYWVVNAEKRTSTLFLDPQPDGTWRLEQQCNADDVLTPTHAPELAVKLADL